MTIQALLDAAVRLFYYFTDEGVKIADGGGSSAPGEPAGDAGEEPEEARKALETILGGPLRFTASETPEGKRCRIEGVVALGAVVAVEGSEARAGLAASPAGFEPWKRVELRRNHAGFRMLATR
ncbi:hypothetical protein [Sorangium sp. So ce1151]|uniref:hypothetical protein n=1 Tax=Sorangium sp. So ce1151 TaxID=3133332 RepID=UPI003F63506B